MRLSSITMAALSALLFLFTGAAGAYDPDTQSIVAGSVVKPPEAASQAPGWDAPQPPSTDSQEPALAWDASPASEAASQPLAPAQDAPSGQITEADIDADEFIFPQPDLLMSAGILVDGLEYDLPMPWGHEEFEELREYYLTAGGKRWLKMVMQRSLPYLAFVEEKIHELELPPELLFLPVIESEYSPYAVSKSGATGIWQFMRNSIAGYGLEINEWKDDRRDFMKSSTAALLKLRDNYKALSDWSLAIAAYNAGLGAVSRAVRNAKGESIDFWHLYESKKLPKESLAYVPKFLAVASILRYPELHGIAYEWGDTLAWETLPLDRQVDIGLLSEKTEVSLDLLKRGNAELNYGITPPAKGHLLKVPAEGADAIKAVLEDSSSPLFKYNIYTVKSGDTLSAISKRYATPLSMVVEANPGIKPDKIRIGQRLIIPQLTKSKNPIG